MNKHSFRLYLNRVLLAWCTHWKHICIPNTICHIHSKNFVGTPWKKRGPSGIIPTERTAWNFNSSDPTVEVVGPAPTMIIPWIDMAWSIWIPPMRSPSVLYQVTRTRQRPESILFEKSHQNQDGAYAATQYKKEFEERSTKSTQMALDQRIDC